MMSKIQKIFFADTETSYTDNTKSERYAWIIGIKEINEPNNSCKVFTGKNAVEEFIEYLIEVSKTFKVKVYFHNLEYDWSYIAYRLNLHGAYFQKKLHSYSYDEIRDDTALYKTRLFYTYYNKGYKRLKKNGKIAKDENGNTIFILDEKGERIPEYTSHCIEFLDSYKLFPFSVEVLGKSVGVKKLCEDFDYNLIREYDYKPTEKEIEYLNHDIDIVENMFRNSPDYVKTSATIGSCALKYYKNNCFPIEIEGKTYNEFKDLFPSNPNIKIRGLLGDRRGFGDTYTLGEIFEEILTGYFGGITQVNKIYQGIMNISEKYKEIDKLVKKLNRQQRRYLIFKGKELILDINSLYPYIMETAKLPYGIPEIIEFPSLKQLKKCNKSKVVFIKVEGIIGCVRDDKLPTIPRTRKQKISGDNYINTLYGDSLLCTLDEFLNLHSINYNINNCTITKAIIFKGSTELFKKYVNYFKELKITSELNGDKVGRTIAKLFSNNLYGKFGERIEKRNILKSYDFTLEKWVKENKENKTKNDYCFPPIAVAVCSYARQHIMSMVNQIPFDKFLYMDTDSIHFLTSDKFNEKDIEKLNWIDSTEYGKLKCENTNDVCIYLAPKKYAFIGVDDKGNNVQEIKCAGLPQNAKENIATIDEFYYGYVTNDKLSKCWIKGGIDLTETLYSIQNPMNDKMIHDKRVI